MKLISIVCHPLLMASYMSLILIYRAPELFAFQPDAVIYFFLAVFLTTCLLPAFSIFSLKLFSNISSFELTDRKERPLPFLIILIWYGISSYLFIVRLQLDPPFTTILIAVTILIFLLFILTKWFKISIHATAAWSTSGILAALIITEGIFSFCLQCRAAGHLCERYPLYSYSAFGTHRHFQVVSGLSPTA